MLLSRYDGSFYEVGTTFWNIIYVVPPWIAIKWPPSLCYHEYCKSHCHMWVLLILYCWASCNCISGPLNMLFNFYAQHTVELCYNLSFCTTSSVVLHILWYQLITHKVLLSMTYVTVSTSDTGSSRICWEVDCFKKSAIPLSLRMEALYSFRKLYKFQPVKLW